MAAAPAAAPAGGLVSQSSLLIARMSAKVAGLEAEAAGLRRDKADLTAALDAAKQVRQPVPNIDQD